MAIGIDWSADAEEFARDLPTDCTFGSDTVTGTAGAKRSYAEIDPGDEYEVSEIEWFGPSSDFTTAPDKRDVVTVGGVKYTVMDARSFEGTLHLSLRHI